MQWRKPGAEFGGRTESFFADKDDAFLWKNFHFSGKNFWGPFSIHRPDFSNFPSLLPDFPDLCFVIYRTQPFPHKKNTFFTLFILSRTSDNTTSQNIWGPSPHLKLWGDSLPKFPPLAAWVVWQKRYRKRAMCPNVFVINGIDIYAFLGFYSRNEFIYAHAHRKQSNFSGLLWRDGYLSMEKKASKATRRHNVQ